MSSNSNLKCLINMLFPETFLTHGIDIPGDNLTMSVLTLDIFLIR